MHIPDTIRRKVSRTEKGDLLALAYATLVKLAEDSGGLDPAVYETVGAAEEIDGGIRLMILCLARVWDPVAQRLDQAIDEEAAQANGGTHRLRSEAQKADVFREQALPYLSDSRPSEAAENARATFGGLAPPAPRPPIDLADALAEAFAAE